MRAALTAVAIMLAAAPNAAQAEPYWKARGCDHGHRSAVAYKRVSALMRHHRPDVDRARIRHYATCVATAAKRRAVWRHVRRSWLWRRSYPHRWPIRFNRLPSWDRAWAWSTGECESGNDPATNTGNGFHGAFQFLLSTWWAAGGTGVPEQHSWHYQAVIAVGWMHRAGAGQWPVCG